MSDIGQGRQYDDSAKRNPGDNFSREPEHSPHVQAVPEEEVRSGPVPQQSSAAGLPTVIRPDLARQVSDLAAVGFIGIDEIVDKALRAYLYKIGTGRLGLQSVDFDLQPAVERVAVSLAQQANDRRLPVSNQIHHNVPLFLRGDPGRLRQMLAILGNRLIRDTAPGAVALRVEVEIETETHAMLRFVVAGTDLTAPSAARAEAMQQFLLLEDADARQESGPSSAGLSIFRQLVEMNGGQFGVTAGGDLEIAFWCTTIFEKRAVKAQVAPAAVDLRGIKLLQLDESATQRAALSEMLTSFGCQVTTTTADGVGEALRRLKAAAQAGDPFRMLLLDVRMLAADSEQYLRVIRADVLLQDTKIVLLTSLGRRGDAARLEELECHGYLTRPITQSELQQALAAVLAQDEQTAIASPQLVTRHTVVEQGRQQRRILLADDEPMSRKLMGMLLQKAGYTVESVENGLQAVEALQEGEYNLVLMDLEMPVLGGLEATQQIRAQEGAGQHTPIIVMTAHIREEVRAQCLAAGMDDQADKALSLKELIALIERWVQPQSAEADDSDLANDRAEPHEAPLDLKAALPHFGNDMDFFVEMLHEFGLDLAAKVGALSAALQVGEVETFTRLAHSLKGLAGSFRAEPLTSVAAELESAGRRGDLSAAPSLLAKIEAEVPRIHAFHARHARV